MPARTIDGDDDEQATRRPAGRPRRRRERMRGIGVRRDGMLDGSVLGEGVVLSVLSVVSCSMGMVLISSGCSCADGYPIATVSCGESWMRSCGARFSPPCSRGEDRGNEDQGGDGGEEQAADDGAAEGRVLLAAFACAERHGDHADDHGEGGHADGTEAGGAGLDGGDEGVAVCLQGAPWRRRRPGWSWRWRRPCT